MAGSARRSVSELLREAADRLEELERSSGSDPPQVPSQHGVEMAQRRTTFAARPPVTSDTLGRHPVDAEVSRLFSSYNVSATSRQPRHAPSNNISPMSSYTHTFCCLARKDRNSVPSRLEKQNLLRAGLGERRLCFRGGQHNPQDFAEFIFSSFPKLRDGGGFELMRTSGNTRSRQLVVIPCPNVGYTVQYLKDPSLLICHATIYIRPLQCSVSLEQESNNEPCTNLGPQTPCLRCGNEFPFSQIRQHVAVCARQSQGESEREKESENGDPAAPTTSATSASTSQHPVVDLTESQETGSDEAGPSVVEGPQHPIPIEVLEHSKAAWVIESVPAKAAELYIKSTRESNQDQETLTLTLSLRSSLVERDRAIITFYKRPRVQWTRPLQCNLIGDAAIGEGVNRHVLSLVMGNLQNGFLLDEDTEMKTLLFEGEQDHLIPSTSKSLLESDFFVVAGRIIGHTFLNGGPHFVGLSPAIMHVLFGGEPELTTITESDCVDQDVRDVLQLLEGTKDLSQDEKSQVLSVTLPWDLPGVTQNNRWWLRENILLHAVLRRTAQQVKQMRRGLKDTGVWEFFSSRPDAVPVLFPRACDAEITPEMILDNIIWPREEDIDEDVVTLEDHCRIMNFLRKFIETGTPELLKNLLIFWTGWGTLSPNLGLEVIDCSLPQSSTCFLTLKLSKNILNYDDFHRDLMASISSSYSGFGLI